MKSTIRPLERITYYNIEKESYVSACQYMAGTFNDAASSRPKGSPVNLKLRFDLIKEEINETIEAIKNLDEVKVIDGLCDVLYVTYGAAHVTGLTLDTERSEKQTARISGVNWDYLFDSINDLRWQLHWIQLDMRDEDMPSLEKDLRELAVECWEMAFKGLGIDLYPFYEEVHRTNMAKLGGPKRADGKQLKPDGWQPPRIAEMLSQLRNGAKSV